MAPQPEVRRSAHEYPVSDIALVRSDGERVALERELDFGGPVLLNFIYTTCTTICPVMAQTFADVQERLGTDAARVRMVSISIDPEEDTPARLVEYAGRFHAGRQWTFLTGSVTASVAAQRTFDVYRGDKMNHAPATFVRPAPGSAWIRLDGFVTPGQLLAEIREHLAQGSNSPGPGR